MQCSRTWPSSKRTKSDRKLSDAAYLSWKGNIECKDISCTFTRSGTSLSSLGKGQYVQKQTHFYERRIWDMVHFQKHVEPRSEHICIGK